LTGALRSTGSLLRKTVAVLILVTLGIVLIAFAVANRQDVTISLDPFGSLQNAALASRPLPLFLVLFAVLIVGVLIGGSASWLRHGRWRRTARRLERDLGRLREELEAHKRAAVASPVNIPQAVEPPERLKLKPPAA
jgi:uncharacterized integral membrane protein